MRHYRCPLGLCAVLCQFVGLWTSPVAGQDARPETQRYLNADYGFQIELPASWRGYSVLSLTWSAVDPDSTEGGPLIKLRHPLWSAARPREDLPIMVFTHEQWDLVQREDFAISTAPMPPSSLARNSLYVFALPPRYNFDQLTGWEEVDRLAHGLVTTEPEGRESLSP